MHHLECLNIELDAQNRWVFGLSSMGQGQVFYGGVKGYLMPRGVGWLRDYYYCTYSFLSVLTVRLHIPATLEITQGHVLSSGQ